MQKCCQEGFGIRAYDGGTRGRWAAVPDANGVPPPLPADPCVSESGKSEGYNPVSRQVRILKMFRCLWRVQMWVNNTTKDLDPPGSPTLDLGPFILA